MAVKIVLVLCYLLFAYFLAEELKRAHKWRKLVHFAGRFAFTDEEYDAIAERDRKILRKNKIVEWYWYKPFKELRNARRCGFVKIPVHVRIGGPDNWFFPKSLYSTGRFMTVDATGLGWKDKWDTPRYENPPFIGVNFLGVLSIYITWGFKYDFGAPREERWDDDQYWEQALWTVYYCGNDFAKARETWPWRIEDKNGVDVSTWDDKYIRKGMRKTN
jgi:hypothetical protein